MLTTTIASVPDRREPVAELWAEQDMFAELSADDGVLRLEIYPHKGDGIWRFTYDELIQGLTEARRRLTSGSD